MLKTEGFYFLLMVLGMLVFYQGYVSYACLDRLRYNFIIRCLFGIFILIISFSLMYFGLNRIENLEKNWKKSHQESLNSGIPSPL